MRKIQHQQHFWPQKLAPTAYLAKKTITKNASFTTFPNFRQNSLNAFEIVFLLEDYNCEKTAIDTIFVYWCQQHWSGKHQCQKHQCQQCQKSVASSIAQSAISQCYDIRDMIPVIGARTISKWTQCQKISTVQQKSAPAGWHGWHVFATLLPAHPPTVL